MIVVVYGTRPEAIKLAPLVRELRKRDMHVFLVCTGQHRELLDAVDFVPDVNLCLMDGTQAPSVLLSRALGAVDGVLPADAQWVIVQGDTATAMAGALAAFQRQLPIAHVEAGLRTYDLGAPFPEEGYRQMIDRLATRLYAPTEAAKARLVAEKAYGRIVVTGNTGIDAATQALVPARTTPYPYVLATVHRREAFGAPMESICRALVRITRETDLHVWLPVHPNPAARATVERICGNAARVHICQPMTHLDMLSALQSAAFVLTDSGGLQEEAPTFGVPVLVAREKTERYEAVEAGNAILVGFDEDRIVREIVRLRSDQNAYARMATPRPIFGDGRASQRIADDLLMPAHEENLGRQPGPTDS